MGEQNEREQEISSANKLGNGAIDSRYARLISQARDSTDAHLYALAYRAEIESRVRAECTKPEQGEPSGHWDKQVVIDRLLKAFGELKPSQRSSWIDIDATIKAAFYDIPDRQPESAEPPWNERDTQALRRNKAHIQEIAELKARAEKGEADAKALREAAEDIEYHLDVLNDGAYFVTLPTSGELKALHTALAQSDKEKENESDK